MRLEGNDSVDSQVGVTLGSYIYIVYNTIVILGKKIIELGRGVGDESCLIF